ncbi:MAG: response regulator [Verrucomicrobia bacterium]|nr:response regulator [Verrucomicrobiota bacterium]NBU08124.1 response regulator [Pseudomonadota bacterium]NDA65347.1 response regulator [Verrucomicrobiota bacterium]NDB74636.1 response regulator [Verrucomicrobiota bacterium]NDD36879.1 response regulator [Verrucomicrobiota bacterium]
MKILIADDDPIIRQVLMNLLSKWGYSVVPTTNGAEAWEVLQNDSSLRIGLFDWFMPEINGMELTRRIRDANIAPFYIMLVTARGGKDSLLDALEAGADDFVSKPFDKEILQARIKVGVRSVELQSYLIQRLSAAETAMQGVAQFKNFIPLCSVCGRAKDLNDQWHKLELPFQTGTGDTAFHLCCPDCREKISKVR